MVGIHENVKWFWDERYFWNENGKTTHFFLKFL